MALDSRLLGLVKDPDIHAVAFVACVPLLVLAYLGVLPAIFIPWLWIILIVSGCFVGLYILGAYFQARVNRS
jgi:hypothetical protein